MTEVTETKKKRRWRISRRGFLIGAGVAGAGLLIGWQVGLPAARLRLAETFDTAEGGGEGAFGTPDTRPTAWFEIKPDNHVVFHIPKVEMGQGIHTTLAQIAADELDVSWENISVVPASSKTGPIDGFGTAGSMSVTTLWTPLRETAATMRQLIVASAASQLSVSADSLSAENGFVSGGGQSLSYGEIVANHDGDWVVPEEAPALKDPSEYKYIGKPMQRVDFRSKLTGQAKYGFDMRMEGMLYGAVAYPRTVAGRITSVGPGTAESEPGVVQVVTENDFGGVVAESRVMAEAAVNKLEIETDDGPLLNMEDIRNMVSVGKGSATVIQRDGDANSEMDSDVVAQTVVAEYRTPMAAHAHLEPQAALVDVKADRVDAWVSTQMPELVRGALAEALGREAETINITATYLGGGFGRKAGTEAAVEAAQLSLASGRPVHVGWNRPKEFRAGYLRPPTHHMLKGGLTADGQIHAIDHQQASADVAFLFMPSFFPLMAGADFGATRGARMTYGVPNMRTVAWRTELPFPTGWWRGLGLLANIYAVESFMDEMAHAAGRDPLEFRLSHLPDGEFGERMGNVLRRAAEAAGWGGPLPDGHAHGIAFSPDVGTLVAQVAEVSIENGKPRVHNIHCAIDCGLPINPDGVAAQSQGSIIMGLGSSFLEEITIEEGRITNTNFNTYPLLTMRDTPNIIVDVIKSSNTPNGVGEPPMGPVAAAVANGIFAASGRRIREMPFRM